MADWITIEEARAAEGISRREMYNRLKPGDAHYIVSQDRKLVDGKRGTMVHVASLSPAARGKLLKEELARVQQPASATRQLEDSPVAEAEARGQLSLLPRNSIDTQILAIPPGPGRDLAVRRYRAI